ncbi:MAG TPA: NAD(P)H-binding protein [Bryobacteraceae bacterium]
MTRTLVIGATGTIGRQVVSQLIEAGASIRALVRDPSAAGLPPQAEVVRGDLTHPETLDRPLDGVDAVFLVWTAPPATVGPVLERIAQHARRVVYLSAPLKTPHPLLQKPQPNPSAALHAEIERRIESSRLEWTFLRPGMLAANAVGWWAPQIRSGGLVRWPYLAAPSAPIDERDIAAVALRALCGNGNAGADYVLTGPQSLTQREQISIIGTAIGRTLRIEEITPEEARNNWLPLWPASLRTMLLDAWAAAVGQRAFVTAAVEEITGTPARPFPKWAADHAAEFRE